MYLPMLALVLALLLPAFPVSDDQLQTPAPKAACCQMHGDHAGHGDLDAAACCLECQDGTCADCCKDGACKDGACKDGCCTDGCCKDGQCAGCTSGEAACCKKDAPKR
jgi:hypothetical protein